MSSSRPRCEEARSRDRFISVAAHEIKNPLTCLHLLLQHLQRQLARDPGVDREQIAEQLGKACAQSGRIIKLTQDLLDVSRIGAGHLQLSPVRADLVEIAREALDRILPELDAAGCDVTIKSPSHVYGVWDRARLEEVALNLLSNAAKYGQGRPVRIRIECVPGTTGASKACLSVEDQGQGIRPEHHESIFEPFNRAGRAEDGQGHGMGLYVVRQILHAHGGIIRVQSKPGRGSVFRFEIPCD